MAQTLIVVPYALIASYSGVTLLRLAGVRGRETGAARAPLSLAPRFVLPAAVAIGICLRVWLAVGFRGNWDGDSFVIVASTIADGGDIYATGRYNYSPLWAYVAFALQRIAHAVGLPLHVLLRGLLTGFDVLNAWLIYRIAEARAPGAGHWACAAYLLNPVAILVVGYQGQLESLAATPLLVATERLQRQRRSKSVAIWLLVTLSVLVKQSLVFLAFAVLLVAMPTLAAGGLMMATLAAFLLSLAPWLLTNRESVLTQVLGYAGVGRTFGTALVAPASWAVLLFTSLVLAVTWVAARRLRLAPAAVMHVVAVASVALITSASEQMLITPLLFSSGPPGLWYSVYTVASTVLMLGGPHYLAVLPSLLWFDELWPVAAGWLIGLLLPWPWLATVRSERRKN